MPGQMWCPYSEKAVAMAAADPIVCITVSL